MKLYWLILDWNSTAGRLFRYRISEVVGSNHTKEQSDEDRAVVVAQFAEWSLLKQEICGLKPDISIIYTEN